MSRAAVAALLSGLACPGAGQIYNRQYVKGGLLVALTLGIIGAFFYATWEGMIEVAVSLPPDEALEDPFGLARGVVEADRSFYDRATIALLVIWVYGILDAYVVGRRIKDAPHPGKTTSAP